MLLLSSPAAPIVLSAPSQHRVATPFALSASGLVHRTSNGISVTALRLTLLDGSGARLNLGRANLTIKKSGL